MIDVDTIETLSDYEARNLLRDVIESLELAEQEGLFGNESWQGALQIEDITDGD